MSADRFPQAMSLVFALVDHLLFLLHVFRCPACLLANDGSYGLQGIESVTLLSQAVFIDSSILIGISQMR